jgi:hypothetical protein
MDHTINCPHCGQPLRVDSAAAGQPIRCSQCSNTFLVPGGAGNPSGPQKRGLAITSLVLGIVSLVLFFACFLGVFCGIPAVILGHLARGRAKKSPDQFGGGGMALAGLIMGYLGLVATVAYVIVMFTILKPAIKAAMEQAQQQMQAQNMQNIQAMQNAAGNNSQTSAEVNSMNNLKQIGLAFRIWEGDHNDQYPCNVSQAQGGTRELCQPDGNGYDQNPVPTFKALSNMLGGNPRLLVCPNDPAHHAAASFASLTADNLSYQLRSGPDINDAHPQEILMVDPINGLVLRCDGSVNRDPTYKKGN